MGYKTRSMHCVLQCVCFMLLHLLSTAQDEGIRSCRTAPCDLVFIVDGSWSVEDLNFEIVKAWLVNITQSFNIGEKFTQVGVVQYSDDPVLEIPLGTHFSNTDLIKAMQNIDYMGGNTRTGTAIKFATDRLFGLSERGPKGIARIAVVLTDGKSQDEVMKAAEAARKKGVILFAIGVGPAQEAELKEIANKPPSSYVFYVEDFKGMEKIRQVIRQKLCEELVCPSRIPVESQDEDIKGFDLLRHLNLAKKAKKTQGTYRGTKAYEVTSRMDLSEDTRALFPDGLPPSYVFVATLKYKGGVATEDWDLWRVQTKDDKPQMAVTLRGIDHKILFTTTSEGPGGIQTVVFSSETAKILFDEKWHQLRLLVTEDDVTLYVDDLEVETLPLLPSVGIFVNGKTQVGKYVNKESTVPFEIQKLRIYCDPEQNERESACEIPGVCSNSPDSTEPTPEPCACPPGPPGLPGLKGEQGNGGNAYPGPPGADGKPGIPGNRGNPGLSGQPGTEGPRGSNGYKGEQGSPGNPGDRGLPGLPGPPGHAGEKGLIGPEGRPGLPGKDGQVGEKGSRGDFGPPGYLGEPGLPGRDGKDGLPGGSGQKGEAGANGIPGGDGRAGHPGMPGLPGIAGLNGLKGEAGMPGAKGFKGSAGPLGEMGLPGADGLTGQSGQKGNKGESGVPGIHGKPGLEGKPGDPGRAGQPGHPGMPGFKGLKGQQGSPGETGGEGKKGDKGEHGHPGAQGSHGSMGPKGEKGITGEQGQRGPGGHEGRPGQPGMTGPAGPRGERGDLGSPGPPGPEGRSERHMSETYIREICRDVLRAEMPSLQLSNQQSACDTCHTRPGSPGSPGSVGGQGPRGFPGLPGSSGQSGHPGRPGRPGVHGIKGDAGFMGEKGNPGRTQVGDPGLPGPPGPMGPQGYSKPGPPGKPGAPGINGSEGKRGITGAPGQPGVCHPSMCYGSTMRRDPFSKGPNY